MPHVGIDFSKISSGDYAEYSGDDADQQCD